MLSKQTIYRPTKTQTITTSGTTATTTDAVQDGIYVVRVHATAACFVAIEDGTATAATSDMFMPAGATEYFQIRPGERVAAIQSTAAGTVYVSEMTS